MSDELQPADGGRWTGELAFARETAEAAGAAILGIVAAGSAIRADFKPDGSVVTAADRAAQTLINERIAARFPVDRIIGEEESRDGSGRTWVVDPLDGTGTFMRGIPMWTVMIALVDGRGQPVVAVIHNPSLVLGAGRTFWATAGGGAYSDGVQIEVAGDVPPGASLRIVGTGDDRPADLGGTALRVRVTTPNDGIGDPAAEIVERGGWPTGFAACLVASGQYHGALYGYDGPHDVAAAALIVAEAGGRVTDRFGCDQRYDDRIAGAVMSNRRCHDLLVRLGFPRAS
jgi:histidinol-phosphatase